MELTLEEAVRGVTKEIRIPTLETCDVVMVMVRNQELVRIRAQPVTVWAKSICAKAFLCTTALSNVSWSR